MTPMLMLGQNFLRTTTASISVPARKVSRMAPKPARKLTQGARVKPTRLPATAPTTISTSATDIATQIEMTDASSASPTHSAEASQTLSIAESSIVAKAGRRATTCRDREAKGSRDGRRWRVFDRSVVRFPPHAATR